MPPLEPSPPITAFDGLHDLDHVGFADGRPVDAAAVRGGHVVDHRRSRQVHHHVARAGGAARHPRPARARRRYPARGRSRRSRPGGRHRDPARNRSRGDSGAHQVRDIAQRTSGRGSASRGNGLVGSMEMASQIAAEHVAQKAGGGHGARAIHGIERHAKLALANAVGIHVRAARGSMCSLRRGVIIARSRGGSLRWWPGGNRSDDRDRAARARS